MQRGGVTIGHMRVAVYQHARVIGIAGGIHACHQPVQEIGGGRRPHAADHADCPIVGH